MLLYADDVTLILRDAHDLVEAERLIALYEAGFGAKFNACKGELLQVSKSSQNLPSDCRFDIKPVEYVTKFLGAPVGCLIKNKDGWEGILNRVARPAKSVYVHRWKDCGTKGGCDNCHHISPTCTNDARWT